MPLNRGIVVLSLFFLSSSISACQQVPAHRPTLEELKLGDDLKHSGRWLIAQPAGLVPLSVSPDSKRPPIIAIHGYESRGYEWVEALKSFGTDKTPVYFYRWAWDQCPGPAAAGLHRELETLMGTDQAVGATVYAHSYGGVIAAEVARADFGEPITLHTIASPLAGHPLLTERCQFDPRTERPLGSQVRLRQWRTIHELDGAFKDLAVDPQAVDIPGSDVVVLPRTYRKRRLGHNWSVVWVAEETAGY